LRRILGICLQEKFIKIALENLARTFAKTTGQAVDSRNLVVRDHVVMQASFVTAGGRNISEMSVLKSTTHQQGLKNREQLVASIKKSFVPFASVHCGSKLIK
jgi:hypothetical protein